MIGLEVKKQLELIDVSPDIMVGNIGGGSNYGGFSLPFMGDKLKKKNEIDFVACESKGRPAYYEGQVHVRLWGHGGDDSSVEDADSGEGVQESSDSRWRP